MNHCFILATNEDVTLALDYYANQAKCKKRFVNKICFVPDSFVLRYYNELFMNIEVFVQNFNKNGDKLDYHGRTITPPTSAAVIKNRMNSKALLRLKSKFNKRISSFYKLLQESVNSQQYIVHLGI